MLDDLVAVGIGADDSQRAAVGGGEAVIDFHADAATFEVLGQRQVGDYISTSFNPSGTAATVFAVGLPQPSPSTFDEAMYAPTTPLTVASGATPAKAGPVLSTGGTGTGALLQSIRKG